MVKLASERDIDIRLRANTLPDGTFGFCVAVSADQYVIVYQSLADVLLAERTLWHELGHIFLDHVTPKRNAFFFSSGAQTLFTDTIEDWEAELFARTIMRYALGYDQGASDLSLAAQQRDPARAAALKAFLDELAGR